MNDQDREGRYAAIQRRWPELFVNPPDAAYEILFNSALVEAAENDEAARLIRKRMPTTWSHTGVVFEDPYLIVVRDAVRRPDESLGTYVRVLPASGSAGSAVLPTLDGQIVLLRHFRHATRMWHLEIPRGFGEPGIPAADLARQELDEEIGAHADRLTDLGEFHSNNGIASDCVRLFLAEIKHVGQPQTQEGISDVEFHSPQQVAKMIGAGTITDSFTIGAFIRAWIRGLLAGLPPVADLGSPAERESAKRD